MGFKNILFVASRSDMYIVSMQQTTCSALSRGFEPCSATGSICGVLLADYGDCGAVLVFGYFDAAVNAVFKFADMGDYANHAVFADFVQDGQGFFERNIV